MLLTSSASAAGLSSATSRDRILRGALCATAGMNGLGAVIFWLPRSRGAGPGPRYDRDGMRA